MSSFWTTFLAAAALAACRVGALSQDEPIIACGGAAAAKDTITQELFDSDVFSSSHLVMVDRMSQLSAVSANEGATDAHSYLVFSPASSGVNFDRVAIGEPASKTITVFNKHANQSVYLGSIMGNVPDFYTSYFSDKVIPPEGNATFNIVFLPRCLGFTVGALMIHTSFGLVKYEVRGEGVECPYRLRPLINVKIPLNATISPEILMYNPHNSPLQILEVYSSGGAFQLELPSGAQEGPQALWEIQPFSTKNIIRVKFTGKTSGNHTAYVRIKIATSADPALRDRMLVIPIEVEVESHQGLFSAEPFIDFGLLAIGNQSLERRNVSLSSSSKHEVDVKSWTIESFDEEVKDCMVARYDESDKVLQLEADWLKISHSKHIAGFISLNYSTVLASVTYSYRIPFVGHVIKGEISYNESVTHFLVPSFAESSEQGPTADTRTFQLHNKFSLPLLVTNVTVHENFTQNFRFFGFIQPVIIPPMTSFDLFNLALVNGSAPVSSAIMIHTNVSVYSVPVHCFDGKLIRIVPLEVTQYDGHNGLDEKEINFGILPISVSHHALIAFVNPNPVPVKLANFIARTTSGSIWVILKGCSALTIENLYLCDEVGPNEWVVFEIDVMAPTVGNYNGKFTVKTEIAGKVIEEIITPVRYTTAMGRLELNKELLHFTDCYPGKLCNLNLSAYSTFMKKMRVEGISVETYGITYVCSEYPEIAPNVVTDIGRLYFDPKELCKTDCYTSFEILSNKTAAKWMSTLNNFQAFSALDLTWLAYRQSLFSQAKKFLKTISFRLTTSQVKRYEFNATVNFIWPKFLPSNINFPTLQIDQEAVKFITIVNPTDHLLLVHYVLHDVNLHGPKLYTPPLVSKECTNCSLNADKVFSFLPPHESEVFIQDIPPHSYAKIGIKFTANEAGTYSTVLYLRNNLTVVESVWITARAVVPQFKFGNRKPGSQTPLMFEVTDKHLKACEKPKSAVKPFVTIKRSFTAKNYGEVPITVYGTFIEDQQCSGFGFSILNCNAFDLSPNSSMKVDIEFSPDFTLARVQRTLFLYTSAGYSVNFTLLGTVPPYALETCSKAILRPDWENTYRRVSASVLTIAFFVVLLTAFLDSDRVLRDHLHSVSRDRGPVAPPLDLRQIATSLQQEATATAPLAAAKMSTNLSSSVSTAQKQKRKSDPAKSNGVTSKGNATTKESNGIREFLRNPRNKRQNNNNNNNNSQRSTVVTPVEQPIVKPKKELVEVEETSSTTTESSFNSDDTDSRNTSRSSPKTVPAQPAEKARKTQKLTIKRGGRQASEPKNFSVAKEVTLSSEPVEKKQNRFINGTSVADEKQELSAQTEILTTKTTGKTPGRERTSKPIHQPISKAKALPFNSLKPNSNNNNSFQFDLSLGSGCQKTGQTSLSNFLQQASAPSQPMAATSSIWSTSFSDVVAAQQTAQLPDLVKPVLGKPSKSIDMLGYNGNQHQPSGGQSLSRRLMQDQSAGLYNRQMENLMDQNCVPKRNSSNLGPIGPKRFSPNLNWEPMMGSTLQQPMMSLPKPTPAPQNMSENMQNSRFLDSFRSRGQSAEQAAYDSLMSNSYSYFDDPNVLLAMYNRQQQAQQLMQAQQQMDNGGWSTTTSTATSSASSMWTPMGYSHQQQTPNSHSMWPLRPPPGLSQQNQTQQQQQQQQQPEEEMRTYDPFKSVSYLWQGNNDPWGSDKKQQ